MSRRVGLFISALVVLNIVALVLESVASIRAVAGPAFAIFETVSVAVFTAEYVARVWAASASDVYAHPIRGRLRFVATPLAIADLLAVVPFFLPFLGVDLRFVRGIRFLRLVRFFKLGRYSRSLQLMMRVARRSRRELVLTVWLVALLLVFASCAMFQVEHHAQPKTFSNIPTTMWWAVATLTTVGYGDIYPVTPLGRLLASLIAFLGIGLFALPTGILGAGFVHELEKRHRVAEQVNCPHCGGTLK
ncbi:MAG: ion transporter [Deltaproteobacteria bacterium]|nr:ion transporter [Deltaproteobacteria bacterium]